MIDQRYLNECFEYDSVTGHLWWKTRPRSHFNSNRSCNYWNGRYPGSLVKTGTRSGYIQVGLGGRIYLAHRVIWHLVYGEWPEKIDHINGDKLDNRLENLRDVCQKDNNRNKRLYSSNTSGISGVHWDKDRAKWVARISHNGKKVTLGVYDDIKLALKARREGEKKYNFHKNHGRV